MNSVRSFFLLLAAGTFVGILAALTASLTVVFAGILSVSLAAKALTSRMQAKTVPVRSRYQRKSKDLRVWNDGHGTIIDM